MSALGFRLSESLSGSYFRLDEPMLDRPMSITLDLEVQELGRFARDRKVDAAGRIFADGLAEGAEGRPIFGALHWRLLDERRIPYDLEFQGDDGRHYRMRGQREFFPHDPASSLMTLAASLYDSSGVEFGRARLRGGSRAELVKLFRSFRPKLDVPLLRRSR